MKIKADVLNSVALQDGLNFCSNQVLNLQRVLDFIGFSVNDIAQIADVPAASVQSDQQLSPEIKQCMEEIANICNLIFQFFDDEVKTKLWLQTSNPMLGYAQPRNMILAGRHKKLLNFVTEALDDGKTTLDPSQN